MILTPHDATFVANGIVRFTGGMLWPNRVWIKEVSRCWGIQSTQEKYTFINKAGAAQEPYAGATDIMQMPSGEFPSNGFIIPSVGPFCTIVGLDQDLDPAAEWEARISFLTAQDEPELNVSSWFRRFRELNSSLRSLIRE
jgi:hypothetical protein